LAGQNLPIREAQALVRSPDGKLGTISLAPSGDEWQVAWKPVASGVYGINIQVSGSAPDGAPLEREAFLSVRAQPAAFRLRPASNGLSLSFCSCLPALQPSF
jgi:hypothetical protein